MLNIGHPTVPRNCKSPRSTGSEAEPYTLAAVDHYTGIYYETIDTKPAVLKTDSIMKDIVYTVSWRMY